MNETRAINEQACGCITYETTTESGVQSRSYQPCLACALKNAGLMLVEAGTRMTEALEEEREQAESARIQAEDFIGGND